MTETQKEGKHILIVEDEPAIGKALKLKLEREGFTVSHAQNGEKGLAAVKEGGIDLILLDLVMPKMDGFAFLEALKASKKKVPVIVSSNLSQEEDQEKVAAFNVKDYFVKSDTPINEVVSRVKAFFRS